MRHRALKKLSNALTYLHKERMKLGYSELEQDRWQGLFKASNILDKAMHDLIFDHDYSQPLKGVK